jgi:MFS family permease
MHNRLLITAACLLALFSTIGVSLPYPILAPLFASGASTGLNQWLGMPPTVLLCIALVINPAGLMIGSALLGPMSDRYGRRPVLLASALGAALGHALTAAALVVESFPLFVLARFVTGLLEGNNAVARALLADRLQGPLRQRAMSWLNGANYLGWLSGPLLAGLTVGFGTTVPFWIAVAAMLVTSAMVAVAVPAQAGQAGGPGWLQVAREKHALNLLRVPELRTLFIVQLALYCGVTGFYEFYPLWLVEVAGYGAREIAFVTALLCGLMTLTSVIAGHESRRDPLSRASWFAFATALAVAAVAAGNAWIGIVAIVLFGIPNAFYNGIIPAWCAERFGAHGQGAVMGLLSTTFCLANIVMGLAGTVLTIFDTRWILMLGALLAAWAGWRLQGWRDELNAFKTA